MVISRISWRSLSPDRSILQIDIEHVSTIAVRSPVEAFCVRGAELHESAHTNPETFHKEEQLLLDVLRKSYR